MKHGPAVNLLNLGVPESSHVFVNKFLRIRVALILQSVGCLCGFRGKLDCVAKFTQKVLTQLQITALYKYTILPSAASINKLQGAQRFLSVM